MDPKAWYASKAIWGGVIAILAAIAAAVLGITISADDQVALVNIAVSLSGAIGGLLAIVGRLNATRPIKRKDKGTGMGAPQVVGVAVLLVAIAMAGPIACASRVAETPAQMVFGIQSDLTAAEHTALAFVRSDQASPAAKDAVKRLVATAVDAVKAAQVAVRAGDSPTIPAAVATARNAVDALAHYLSETAQ